MTASTRHPDDLTQLLRERYEVPAPPAAFASQLLRRLEARMAETPGKVAGESAKAPITLARTKSWWLYGAVAAAACVAIITAGLVVRQWTNHAGLPQQVAKKSGAPATGAGVANLARPPVPETGHGITLGELSMEDCIGRVSLIVRAKPIGWKDGVVEFTISHVVYGRCVDKGFKLDMSTQVRLARKEARDEMLKEGIKEPVEPELTQRALAERGIVKGKEIVVFLRPVVGPPDAVRGIKFMSGSMYFDVPPRHSLDNVEKEIIQAIEMGKYLEPHPRPGDILQERMRQANFIVRAKLTKVGKDGATWKIVRTVQGRADKDTLIVNFDLFRLRAEAIVNYTLRAEAGFVAGAPRPSKKEVEARIAREQQRLINAELLPGSEAILFVDDCKSQKDGIHANLRHRLYADQEKKNLDELEKAIKDPPQGIEL